MADTPFHIQGEAYWSNIEIAVFSAQKYLYRLDTRIC